MNLTEFLAKTEEEFDKEFPQYIKDSPCYINEQYQEFISTKLRELTRVIELKTRPDGGRTEEAEELWFKFLE